MHTVTLIPARYSCLDSLLNHVHTDLISAVEQAHRECIGRAAPPAVKPLDGVLAKIRAIADAAAARCRPLEPLPLLHLCNACFALQNPLTISKLLPIRRRGQYATNSAHTTLLGDCRT